MKLKLPQLNKTLSCDKGENLFHTLKTQGVPLASSCQGDGVCGKCVVSLIKGEEHLSSPSALETKLKDKYNYSPTQRIACQCDLLGDDLAVLELTTTYW